MSNAIHPSYAALTWKPAPYKNLGAGVRDQLLIVDDEHTEFGCLVLRCFGVAGQIRRRISCKPVAKADGVRPNSNVFSLMARISFPSLSPVPAFAEPRTECKL